MTQRELFPPIPDDVIERVQTALANPFITPCAKAVLERIRHHAGRANAVSIYALQSWWRMHDERIWSDRDVKAAVKELLEDLRVPVGSARGVWPGYFLLCSPEDVDAAEKPLIGEVLSLARRLRAINHKSELSRVICGQLGLE